MKKLPDLACLSRRPILYEDARIANGMGLPEFVRAASSVALVSDRLYVVQDDVNAIAVVDPHTALARPIALPFEGPLQRIKADKSDLEASALLPDGRLLFLGSGSRPEREVAVTLDLDSLRPSLADARGLFRALHRAMAEVGVKKTNIEGLALAGEGAFFLHRGPATGDEPSNVVVRLPTSDVAASLETGEEPRSPAQARSVDLGEVNGTRITWTDGVALYGLGLVFVACAEKTADVVEDGACEGSFLGLLDRRGEVSLAQVAFEGRVVLDKLEGLALAGRRAWAVSDPDAVGEPSHLFELPFGF